VFAAQWRVASSVSQRKKEIEYESKIPGNLERAKFLMFRVPRDALTRPNRTVIDNSHLENHQLAQLTTALKQQMLKEIREKDPPKSKVWLRMW
jgi:hypothetical protein